MKIKFSSLPRGLLTGTVLLTAAVFMPGRALAGDQILDSWFTTFTGKYARVYTNGTAQTNGVTATTWTNTSGTQSLPAYSGVQAVYYSSNWVYIRSTGLGSHVMGPWYLDAGHLTNFPNFPMNTKTFFRIPLTPTNATSYMINGGGAIGYFVDGVAMFNSWDAFYWNGTADVSGAGNGGCWNRDAYVNEGLTFDPAYAHQPGSGQYHYHADPIALRHLLGDHVDYNAATKTYSESTAPVTNHSPILGWVCDGYPIYGPYGYSNATNASSGIRLMVSGYVPRNGLNGTDNLSTNGASRGTIPAWAQRAYNTNAAQSGPTVSAAYPFGRYMEDNDYLGDLGKTQGVDFDLDEHNCRYCVTPEFPGGTYAYFVCISSNGTPLFPYNIGRAYKGNPTGASVTNLTETVTTNFTGGPDTSILAGTPALNTAKNTVTLEWSSVEGGSYQIVCSTNLTTWGTNATGVASQGVTTSTNLPASSTYAFYQVARTSLASYDPVTNSTATGSDGILSVSPVSGSRGTTFTLTINLDPNANPAPPPQNAPINSVTVGSVTGSDNIHVSQTQVTSSITIPSNASTGAQTVTVVFPGPPTNMAATVTYTLTVGFTIQ